MSTRDSRPFEFNDNDYARPNQGWVCGRVADGQLCPLGPTQRGSCRSSAECEPNKQGETWVCARSRVNGGPCEDGPDPEGACCRAIPECRPKRAIKSQRGLVSFYIFALSVGVLLMAFGSPLRNRLFSPGPLSSPHNVSASRKCADCHEGTSGDLGEWLRTATAGDATWKQAQRCLKCHRDLEENAIKPHGVAGERLVAATRRAKARGASQSNVLLLAAAKTGLRSPALHEAIACAACHKEHRGNAAKLVDTSNSQCQTCHTATFAGLSSGHPEFFGYPFDRRSRLYFDHVSHYGGHFEASDGEDSKDLSCIECHVADSAGRHMQIRGFETACGRCHGDQIEDDLASGLPFVSLPGVDVPSLNTQADKGIDIGHWPTLYPLHVEAGELTPLFALLMHSNADSAEAVRRMDQIQLDDLQDATIEQLEDVEQFVWAYKETLYDMLRGGQPWIRQRLETALASQASEDEIAEWASLFPLGMMARMKDRWLPTLYAEVEARRSKESTPLAQAGPAADPVKTVARDAHVAKITTSGWYLQDSDLTLRYRPTGHGDTVLKSLLNVSARLAGAEDQTADSRRDAITQSMKEIFSSISTPTSIGRCVKCHTIDERMEGGAEVNWRAFRSTQTHEFTKFDHSAHMTPLENQTCVQCHVFKVDDGPVYSPFRPEFFHSNQTPNLVHQVRSSEFAPIQKASCTECHNPTAATDDCLSCHNYHIR